MKNVQNSPAQMRYLSTNIIPVLFTNLRKVAFNDDSDSWREHVVAVYLDRQQRVIGYALLGIGGTSECLIEPVIIYRAAV